MIPSPCSFYCSSQLRVAAIKIRSSFVFTSIAAGGKLCRWKRVTTRLAVYAAYSLYVRSTSTVARMASTGKYGSVADADGQRRRDREGRFTNFLTETALGRTSPGASEPHCLALCYVRLTPENERTSARALNEYKAREKEEAPRTHAASRSLSVEDRGLKKSTNFLILIPFIYIQYCLHSIDAPRLVS